MKLLDQLRAVRAARRGDAASVYWGAVQDLAAGRDPKVDAAALERALAELGKRDDDLDADVAVTKDLLDHQRQAGELEQLRQALAAATAEMAAAEDRALELERQAVQLRESARSKVHGLRPRIRAAEEAARQVDRLRRLLAAAGHREIAAVLARETADARRATEAERTEFELRQAEAELARLQHDQDRVLPAHAQSHAAAVAKAAEAVAELRQRLEHVHAQGGAAVTD